jgi:hypothetical protein
LLDLGLEVSKFDKAVEVFRIYCDQAVARDASIQTHVRQLEKAYDAAVDEGPKAQQDEGLNADQLMQELEDFLREEREDGDRG